MQLTSARTGLAHRSPSGEGGNYHKTMEPWLSGAHAALAPIPRLLRCSLDQSEADIRHWTAGLTEEQIWQNHPTAGSIGFQLRHLAGSIDRLITYANGQPLTTEQLQFLKAEATPGATKEQLLNALKTAYETAHHFAQHAKDFEAPRYIGRQRLETPLGVLLAHIAEHTQRHTGQLIVLCKFAYSSDR